MTTEPKTDELLRRAADNDEDAREQLMARHRDRLLRMVTARIDQRLNPRLDPSDIVQNALIKALNDLPGYLEERPVAFYPWLRKLAWEKMVEAWRAHVVTQGRSVARDVYDGGPALTSQSAVRLADVLVSREASPSQRFDREIVRREVQSAMKELRRTSREVLVMRYLEELSMREIADCLEISEAAAKMRHLRALRELGSRLKRDLPDHE